MNKISSVFKKLILLALLVVAFVVVPNGCWADEAPKVKINGEFLSFDTPPVVENARTLVPFRAIAEGLGATVDYNSEEKKVTATKGETTISFIIGENKINVNGQEKELDVAPTVVNGRTMLPARAFAESLGSNVEWQDGTVAITTTQSPDSTMNPNPKPIKEPAPAPPAKNLPPAQGQTNSASKFLAMSAVALSQVKSYAYEGPTTVSYSSAGKKVHDDLNIDQSGAFAMPKQNYLKASTTVPTTAKTGSIEIYSDGVNIYIKVVGEVNKENLPESQWVLAGNVKSSSYTAQSNPFSCLQFLAGMGSSVAFGTDKEINGKKYKTVIVTLNQENIKAALGSILAVAQQEIKTIAGGTVVQVQAQVVPQNVSGKIETAGSIIYYIDPKTMIAEIAEFTGTDTTTITGSTSVVSATIQFNGSININNINQAVTFPDVSGVVEMPVRTEYSGGVMHKGDNKVFQFNK